MGIKVSNMPDRRKRQTLMFSTQLSGEGMLAATDYLRKDYLFLTVSCVSGEEHTKITEHLDFLEPDEESQPHEDSHSDWSGSSWGNPVKTRELNSEQAMTNLTSKFEHLSTVVKEIQKRNDQLQQKVENLEGKNAWLEKKLSEAATHDQTITKSSHEFVTIKKENMSQLLASCEFFQEKLDEMSYHHHKLEERQQVVEDTLKCLSCLE